MRRWVVFIVLTGLIATGCSKAAAPAAPAPPATVAAPQPAPDAAPTGEWAKLAPLRPVAVETAGFGPRLDLTPDGRRVAYCAEEGIRVTHDGGLTWRTVATGPVVGLSDQLGYGLMADGGAKAPVCSGVLVDPIHPDSLYATFAAGSKVRGAPPLYRLGFYTTDSGLSWRQAPSPADVAADTFAGFRRQGDRIRAVFNDSSNPGGAWRVQVTADGGASWSSGSFGCLTDGICLSFGPLPVSTGSCAMHEYKEPLIASADNGRTWSVATAVDGINACFPAELVATGPQQALLVAQSGLPAISLTPDGGKRWLPVSLSVLPGDTNTVVHSALQLLPDGSLIQGDVGSQSATWYLLKPGAEQWCALPAGLIPSNATELHTGGESLWWLKVGGGGAGTTAGRVELASLRCGE